MYIYGFHTHIYQGVNEGLVLDEKKYFSRDMHNITSAFIKMQWRPRTNITFIKYNDFLVIGHELVCS